MRDLSSSEVSMVGGANRLVDFVIGYVGGKAVDAAIEHGPDAVNSASEGMNDYVNTHGAPSSLSNPSAPTIPAPPNPGGFG